MSQSSVLEQALLRLGGTANAVAANLKASGIKGVRNTVRHLNPIVRYAQSHLRLDDYSLDLTQGDGMPRYILRLTLPNGAEEEAPLPEAVREFLDSFNRGEHPELELS